MTRRRTLVRAGMIAIALMVASPGAAVADPGDLDHTFGDDGIVNLPLGAFAVAVAPGNGLWVAGRTDQGDDPAVGITRLRQNGLPDPAFGDGGELIWTYPGTGPYPSTRVSDVAALPGGGVQISGEWCGWTGEGCIGDARSFVARFDATGAADLGFGENGVVSAWKDAFSLTSLSDDTSVHACELSKVRQRKVKVLRYLPDGERDPAFGDNGRTEISIPGPQSYRQLVACGALSDGGTLVATMDGSGHAALRVVKLTSAGEVDPAYGHAGMITVRDREIDVNDAVVHADGRAWFAGMRYRASRLPRVLSLEADGDRDPTFGGADGIAVLRLPQLADAREATPALRSDGSVAVTGYVYGHGAIDRYPYVAMLTPTGEVDTSFGDAGLVSGYADLTYPYDLVIDANDRIVSANSPFVLRFKA